jgi:hypothetical protein
VSIPLIAAAARSAKYRGMVLSPVSRAVVIIVVYGPGLRAKLRGDKTVNYLSSWQEISSSTRRQFRVRQNARG